MGGKEENGHEGESDTKDGTPRVLGDAGGARAGAARCKVFERKQNIVGYNCHKTGHMAALCRKPKVVFSCIDCSKEHLQLLQPYIRNLRANGKDCRLLRDLTATMDAIHAAYLEPSSLAGDYTWKRQVVQEDIFCPPIAQVCIEETFWNTLNGTCRFQKLSPAVSVSLL